MIKCESCFWLGITKQATVKCRICGACFCDDCKSVHAVAMADGIHSTVEPIEESK